MPSSSVSSETPVQTVSSLDHLVTQWMSTVTVSLGSAWNSSHDHETGSSTAPWIVKLHRSIGWCGVGPAESTGKSSVTYWPGGTRDGAASSRRRPRKPGGSGGLVARLNPRATHARGQDLPAALVPDGDVAESGLLSEPGQLRVRVEVAAARGRVRRGRR